MSITKKPQSFGENLKLAKNPRLSTHKESEIFEKESTSLTPGKGPKTRIIIKYDVGYANELYLRGKGAELNWEKGVKLKNIKHDEWIWETEVPFANCEFKVLINDKIYENGENHPLHCGSCVSYTPHFE